MRAIDSEWEGSRFVVSVHGDRATADRETAAAWYRSDEPWIGHGVEADLSALGATPGSGTVYDTLLLSSLLDPDPPHGLAALSRRYLAAPWHIDKPDMYTAEGEWNWGEDVCRRDVAVTEALHSQLWRRLPRHLQRWYVSVEEPFMRILLHAQRHGIPVDPTLFAAAHAHAASERDRLVPAVQALLGGPVNLSSAAQLNRAINWSSWEQTTSEQVGVYKTGRPKRRRVTRQYAGLNLHGADTRALTLLKLTSREPRLASLISHRSWDRLVRGYYEPMSDMAATGVLRCRYNQTGTRSGRVSCRAPNLQTVPKRTDAGRRFRSCIRATEGNRIVSVDYSQADLRFAVAFSGDTTLGEILASGRDVYQETADKLGVPRPVAKTYVLATTYMAGAETLAGTLTMAGTPTSPERVRDDLSGMRRMYPRLFAWRAEEIRTATEAGMVITPISGRHRYLRGIAEEGEYGPLKRQVVTTMCQGATADIHKMGAVAVRERLGLEPFHLVHDEALYMVPVNEADEACEAIRSVMEETVRNTGYDIPVSGKVGEGW